MTVSSLLGICLLSGASALSADVPIAKSPKMDGTWKAISIKFTDGKKDHRVAVKRIQMVIRNGVGTWSNGSDRGTVTVDLSEFSDTSPGFGSAPIDFVQTEGADKGQKWEGICSRCGSTVLVCLSLNGRPTEFKGSETRPVMIFTYTEQEK